MRAALHFVGELQLDVVLGADGVDGHDDDRVALDVGRILLFGAFAGGLVKRGLQAGGASNVLGEV